MDFVPPGLRPGDRGPYDWDPAMVEEHPAWRLTAAFGASAALHAAMLAFLFLRAVGPGAGLPDPPPATLIRVSLMDLPGGGGGGRLPGVPSPEPGAAREAAPLPVVAAAVAQPPPALPPAPAVTKPAPVATPKATIVVRRTVPAPAAPAPVRVPAAPAPDPPPVAATAPDGSGAATPSRTASLGAQGAGKGAGGDGATGGGGAGTGAGSGGDGSDAQARPAHGSNPKPPYPMAARRLGVEGVVTLEVVVRPDGSPADVRVRSSSGSALLDDSARDTVRTRWRFVPARRGDTPVESRVTFPIRFRLDAS